MAAPAFIYAFDSLGPDRFVELCGLLLGARYKGFLLSGPGADGGVDGEVSPSFGQLCNESRALLNDRILDPEEMTLFQFKHKVVARVGQSGARSQLLSLYRTTPSRKSELHRNLVVAKNPQTYVLVTNVETNAQFRESFRELCRTEPSGIKHFEVIGLDDLQSWVSQDHHLRAMFFPMIFGKPRFELSVVVDLGYVLHPESSRSPTMAHAGERILQIQVRNSGEATSYISHIKFKAVVDGKIRYLQPTPLPKHQDPLMNPESGAAVAPGQSLNYRYYLAMLQNSRRESKDFWLAEILAYDQIGNIYVCEAPEAIREAVKEDN